MKTKSKDIHEVNWVITLNCNIYYYNSEGTKIKLLLFMAKTTATHSYCIRIM